MPDDSAIHRLFSLQGKVALVTGASGGIGRALAAGLAGAGAAVAVHGRDAEDLEVTRKQVEAAGARAAVFQADLADPAACRKLVADTVSALGRLDVLVNCAGMNRRKQIPEFTEDDFDTIVDVNLKGPFVLSQAAYPVMKRQGGGKVIHVGSITSTLGLGGTAVYGMTKSALWQLTRTMAVEWARDNIQVNCLAPGFIHTPLTEKAVWGDPKRSRWLLHRIPAGRPGKPEEMVGTVLLLASPASDYLTGQLLIVDGGFLAGGWWDLE